MIIAAVENNKKEFLLLAVRNASQKILRFYHSNYLSMLLFLCHFFIISNFNVILLYKYCLEDRL